MEASIGKVKRLGGGSLDDEEAGVLSKHQEREKAKGSAKDSPA